ISLGSSLANGAASVISNVTKSIENLALNNATAPGTLEFLQKTAAFHRVSGGTVAGQLAGAGNGSISITDVVSNVTLANLSVWANATTIGNLRPPVVTLVADANLPTPHVIAGAGQTNYIDFPVTVSGTSSSLLPISVQYTTSDNTALVSRGDYTPANGTLTWAPGDTSTKNIRVYIGTGSFVDIAKVFNLNISNPSNSILEYSTTAGTIDYAVFNTTTSIATSNSTVTALSPVTLTVNSKYLDLANSSASGTVSLYDGVSLLGNVPLSSLGIATFTTSSLTAGTHTISARYSGYNIAGAVYNSSQSSNLTLTVVKANQTITVDPIANATYGSSPITPTGNTTYNLPISYSIVSGPVSYSSGKINILGTGHDALQATQAGNDWINPAPAVNFGFDVTPATLSVIIDSKSIAYGSGSLPS
ncbi:MAG: Ig-like domain repeat protein, partial [bacterium]